MHQIPKISIIVPVYDVEKYLPKCLNSLLEQTVKSIEIIAVNDGSTDKSLDILETYAQKDKRIRVLNHKHQGVSYTRQVGLEQVSAPSLMFCDADDWYQPTMCQEMLNALETHDVDIVKCNIVPIDEEEDLKRTDIKSYYRVPCSGRYKITEEIKLKTNVCLVSTIFKMSFIKKFAISFPEKLKAHEDDVFMFMYLSVARNIFFLDKDLYFYWRRANSLTPLFSMGGLKNFDRCLLMRPVYIFLQKHDLWAEERKIFLTKYFYLFRISFLMATEQQKKELIQHEQLFIASHINPKDDEISSKCKKMMGAIRRLDLIALKDMFPIQKKKWKFAGFTVIHEHVYQHKIVYKLLGLTYRTQHITEAHVKDGLPIIMPT